jgi:hypothetical protein
MAIYVDRLIPRSRGPSIFRSGSCHLFADDRDELHAFARRIGLKREWFQDHPTLWHYDLTPGRRTAAVRLGAREIMTRELAEKRLPPPR